MHHTNTADNRKVALIFATMTVAKINATQNLAYRLPIGCLHVGSNSTFSKLAGVITQPQMP